MPVRQHDRVAAPLALDLRPIVLTIHINYQGILSGNRASIADAESQVRASKALATRRAGLVLAFGGSGQAAPNFGIQVAKAFDANVLADLGRHGYVFQATVYREFFSLGSDPGTIEIDVYVFKQ